MTKSKSREAQRIAKAHNLGKRDWMNASRVLIPVRVKYMRHWVMMMINMKARKFAFYDSLSSRRRGQEVKKDMMQYLKEQVPCLDLTGWQKNGEMVDVPQQGAGTVDCGICMCNFLSCAAEGRKPDIAAEQVAYMRRRLVLKIANLYAL